MSRDNESQKLKYNSQMIHIYVGIVVSSGILKLYSYSSTPNFPPPQPQNVAQNEDHGASRCRMLPFYVTRWRHLIYNVHFLERAASPSLTVSWKLVGHVLCCELVAM